MQRFGTFLGKAAEVITLKAAQQLQSIALNFTNQAQPIDPQPEQISIFHEENHQRIQQLPPKQFIQDEKVLEIDVIESGYLIKTEEELPLPQNTARSKQLPSKQQTKPHHQASSQPLSRIKQIEEEKRLILEELKLLDQEIAEIKGQDVEDGAVKRREKQIQNAQANKQAKDLVKNLKAQKKQLQERKRKEAEKSLMLIKQQEEERKAKQAQEAQKIKEQRRKAIEARLEEQKRKREERKLIEKESNRLIKQLKKEEEVLKQREELPQETNEIQQKKKVFEKKNQINFRDIEDHQRRYVEMKERNRQMKKERAESVGRSVPHYQKNMWLELIEEQEQKRKEEEKLKELSRKETLEKRKRYGELVKNIFIPKIKKEQTKENQDIKPTTPDTNLLPRIPDSQKRVTDSKPMKKFMEQNRPFATAHHPKPPKPQTIQKKQQPEDLQKERERKAKQAEMRRVTKERLKKLENRSLEALPQAQSKPKYENYLGRVKVRADNDSNNWKKVIQDQKMSKEDKYKEMLKRAAAMESRAKVKENIMKEGDQQAVNLYIGSIQAKLAILEKF